ncbi:uncharacterized protein LOC128919883 [Zeugodacus cucurbitae]|uniref:uncharacterized protein LOC128919883 n=2 Tax=Zeugodacus cucurbitae TaxID=28588 RepID=UPI0023D944B6|nr:uncharacterized protein LOC128919883 [Zeugodacus cucurbitae]
MCDIYGEPSQGNDEFLELLKSWGLLNEIIDTLIERGVNSFLILEKMQIDDVDAFFNRCDAKYFGERIKFKAGLREWRTKKGIPFICDQETQTANTEVLDWLKKISSDLSSVKSGECSMLPCSPQTKNFNLRELLKTSVKGQLALSYQEKHGYLDSRNQKNLTHCIVDNYIGLGRKMQYSDMREWANEIVAVFPKEKKEFYFLERKMGKKNPSGKLFSRWANAIKLENKANPVTQEAYEDVFDDNVLEKKCWLAHNCTPWEKVKKFWLDTCTFRNKCKGSLSDLLADWPRYNDFNGYELVRKKHKVFIYKLNIIQL